MNNDIIKKTILTEREAAAYLGRSVSTLRKSRMVGSRDKSPMPPYVKLGRSIRYLTSDLDQFLAKCRITGAQHEF